MTKQLSAAEISSYLNITKFFAILSVVMAHSRSSDFQLISGITERLGSIGVICFFIISGYYFKYDSSFLIFVKKKINSLFIPWISGGTIVYFIINKHFDIAEWLLWIIGYYTYLYYLTVLLFCFFIFYFVRNIIATKTIVLLTIISIITTSLGIWDDVPVYPKNFPPYLNILNWLGFFAIGILIKDKLKTIGYYLRIYRVPIIISFLLLVQVIVFFELDNDNGYFSFLAFPLEIFGAISFFCLSTFKFFELSVFSFVSKVSFSIYLYHFLAFPLRVFLPSYEIIEFFKPIYYVGICSLFFYISAIIGKQLGILNVISKIFGFRL